MLDTLTNVVGVLVIVLVSVMLAAEEAASKIEEAVTQMDQDQVRQIQEQADRSREEVKKIKRKIAKEENQKKRDPEKELKRIEEEVAKVEKEAEEDAKKAAELEKKHRETVDQVTRERAQLEQQIKQLEDATKKYEAESAALTLQLEKMEKPEAPPIKEVRLPNPRKLPTDAQGKPIPLDEVIVLCQNGRIYGVMNKGVQELVQKKLDFTVKQKRLDPDGDNWLVDDPKTLKALEDNMPNDDNFELSLLQDKTAVFVVLTPKARGGETPQQAMRGDFSRAMRVFGGKVRFRYFVFSDSFEQYLEMRKFTDRAGFLAGWVPMRPDYVHRIRLKYNIGEKPPPAPPPPPGTTPPPQPPPKDEYLERVKNSVID